MEKTFKDTLMGWGALAGIIAVAISTFFNYHVGTDPEARPDSCTGTRCGAHESRTAELEEWAHIVELRLQAIEQSREECQEHIRDLRQAVDGHLRVSERKILEYNVKLKEHSVKIDQCLKHMRFSND